MKAKHRRSHRRYNGKRRSTHNRSILAITLLILFIIAVIVASVFLGKYLKQKAEISEASRDTHGSDTDYQSPSTDNLPESILFDKPPASFKSEYMPITDIDAYLENAEDGASVTLILRNSSGELFYSSATAQALGSQSIENGLPSCDELMQKFSDKNCYLSVYIAMTDHSSEASPSTNALHAFESALISEIGNAGADEVMLCGFNNVDEEKVSVLCDFSAKYRLEGSKTPLGILLPYSFFTLSNANELCRRLYEYFEVIAVDYTDVLPTEDSGISDIIDDRIDTMQMYFSRYGIRIVFDADSADIEAAFDCAKNASITSVQSVSRADMLIDAKLPPQVPDTDTAPVTE